MAEKAKSDFDAFDRKLTVAIVAPPLAWLTQLTVGYALVPTACVEATKLPLHLTSVFAIAIAGVCAFYGWRVRPEADEPTGDPILPRHARRRFMALTAAAYGVLFALLIVATEIPNWIHRSCD